HCFEGHQNTVAALAFAPDGRVLASGSYDTTLLLWEVAGRGAGVELPAGELEAVWAALAGEDARAAYRAGRQLEATPRTAAAFLAGRLRPATAEEPERLARLIRKLDDDAFAAREEAGRELEKLGEQAVPALRRALEGQPSPEVRKRVTALLSRLEGQPPAGETLGLLRAGGGAEHLGTPQAGGALRGARGRGAGGATLTGEARAALARLTRQQGSNR